MTDLADHLASPSAPCHHDRALPIRRRTSRRATKKHHHHRLRGRNRVRPFLLVAAIIATTAATWLLSACGVRAAHSRRRRAVRTTTALSGSSAANNYYDRSVTAFDPTGRLRQVEHGWTAAARGHTVAAAVVGDTIYVVTTTATTATATTSTARGTTPSTASSTSRSAIPKLHPLDHRPNKHRRCLWVATAGMAGDARWLAERLRQTVLRAAARQGRPATVREAARAAARIQHALTVTAGLRPLGVTALLFGFDGDDDDHQQHHPHQHCEDDDDAAAAAAAAGPQLFRCSAGGVQEDCRFCCAGAHHEAVQNAVANCYRSALTDSSTTATSSSSSKQQPQHEIVERLVEAVWEGLGQTTTTTTTTNRRQRGSSKEDEDEDEDEDNRTELEVWMFSRKSNPICFTGIRDGASLAKVEAFLTSRDDSAEQAVSP